MKPVIVITLYQHVTTKLSLDVEEAKRLRDVLDDLLAAVEDLPEGEEFQIVGSLAP